MKNDVRKLDGSLKRYLENPPRFRATGKIVEENGKMVIKDMKITGFNIPKPELSK